MRFRDRAPYDPDAIDWIALRTAALAATRHAYAPYSGFPVGAAALVDDGRIVTACNVESASYGLTLCAEAGLISVLYAGGGGRLRAVACRDGTGASLMPCGSCRQLLWEHGGPHCLVDTEHGGPVPMADLLPRAFDVTDLERVAGTGGHRPGGRSANGGCPGERHQPAAPAGPGEPGDPAGLAELGVPSGPDEPGGCSAGSGSVPPSLGQYVGCGTVFVHPDAVGGRPVWTAYWERSSGLGGGAGEPVGILEEAPNWPDVGAAVRWGQARTPRVVVVDATGGLAWAGVGERPAGLDRAWGA